jgi:hypothetical protein
MSKEETGLCQDCGKYVLNEMYFHIYNTEGHKEINWDKERCLCTCEECGILPDKQGSCDCEFCSLCEDYRPNVDYFPIEGYVIENNPRDEFTICEQCLKELLREHPRIKQTSE